jgi:predicted O-methyltransferase YrrM
MPSMVEEIRNLTAGIDGWLTDEEGALLFELARDCMGRGAIVEIGSWKGKSTIWLGRGSMAGRRVKVWAIDPHTGSEEHRQAFGRVSTFKEFEQNIASAGLTGLVTPIVKTSQDAAVSFEGPVELLFIDGAHDYVSTKSDFQAWFPKVVDGGIVAFHDTTGWDGPRRVVLENVCTSRSFGGMHLVGSVAYAPRVPKNSAQDRIRNLSMTCVIGPSIFLRRALPRPIRSLGRKAASAIGICR